MFYDMSTHWKSRNAWLASYNHPNWQRKRLEILKRDEFKCHKARHEEKPEEGMSNMQQWEQEMDWILNGRPSLSDRFWYLAAAISQAAHPECGAARRELEMFIDSRIVQSKMQEATE